MTIHNLIHTKNYEKITAKVRRHFITYVPTILFFIILLLVPIALYWLIQNLFPSLLSSNVAYTLSVLLASVYYLSVMLFLYTSFVEFYLDIHIITNDRMIDVNQITLFARKIAEADLYQIQDVSSEVRGFFASIFNYGNVDIQTAGSIPKFKMENVSHPHELRRLLLDLASEDRKFHNKISK